MVELNNITKKYTKNGQNIIDGISLKINDGEAVAFVGANGAGKTTLVEIIAGIVEPTSGDIKFSNHKSDAESKIGIQFQSGNWPYNTKTSDLMSFFVGRKWKEDEYIKKLIDVFEVGNFLNKKLTECSGGEQQRFNCLLSIIEKPDILILDELITGLDLKMQIKLIDFFDNLRKEEDKTLLVVSHIPEEVEQICNRVIILKEGKIHKDFKMNEIIDKYKSVRKCLVLFFNGEI